jgi:hypothetical protein
LFLRDAAARVEDFAIWMRSHLLPALPVKAGTTTPFDLLGLRQAPLLIGAEGSADTSQKQYGALSRPVFVSAFWPEGRLLAPI